MSGPLSSNEIEDVVSSVRRLVSAEARPRPMTRDLGQDRLVLTPALRVVSDTAEAPLILTDPAAAPQTATPAAPVAEMAPATLQPVEIAAVKAEATVAGLVEAEWEDELWHEQDPPLAELALGAEEAELVGPSEGSPVLEDAWVQADPGWPDEDELAAVIPIGTAARAAPESPARAEAPGSAAEPVAPVQASEPTMETAGAGRTEEIADGDPALDAEMIPTLYDKDGNPLTVLDEDALHDIVRQLIREELQGALGERITRNVRKLVRAEINRALTARALD